jgi:hypothetical protein
VNVVQPLRRLFAWLESRPVFRYAWDNPSAEADARSILTSPKVGGWLGLEILLIIATAVGTLIIAPAEERDLRDVLDVVGAGGILIDATFLTITVFLTLILPFRASGLLEGPRWRGYMDQLITTGVSPLRYYAGKWASSQPFILALLLASLPFVVLFGLLGGADAGRILVGYTLLYLYANLVLSVACGLGALVHEGLAVALTLSLFGFAVFLSFAPVPSVVGSFTPVRYFVQAAVGPMSGAVAQQIIQLYGSPTLMGVTLPWLPFTLGLWGLIFASMVLTCTLGPLHTFVPGLNNFGALVFHGDKKRFRFRKVRPLLSRRTELAFLFDNRPPALGRWALPLRGLQLTFFLGLVPLLMFSGAFCHPFMKEIPHEIVLASHSTCVGAALMLGLLLLNTGRAQSLARFHLGVFKVPQYLFDVGAFVLLLAWICVLHLLSFALTWEDLAAPRPFWTRSGNPQELFHQTTVSLGVVIPMALSTFLVMKLAASRWLGKGWVLALGVLFVFFMSTVPALLVGLSNFCADPDRAHLNGWAAPIYALAQMSPATQLVTLLDRAPRWIRSEHWLVMRGFWFWHALLIAFLGFLCARSHASAMQEADVFAAADPYRDAVAAGNKPCPRCESVLQVPLAFPSYGGVLLTRFVKEVRCLDCGQAFLGPTGQPRGRLFFYTGLLLTFILVGGAVMLTLLLLKVT